MKILVLSDSHEDLGSMEMAVGLERPQQIFHLGDHIHDARRLQERFPRIPLVAVPGNCDRDKSAPLRLLQLEGQRLLLCHGHSLGVKNGLLRADLAAREQGAQVLLFGHTHRPYCQSAGDLLFLNPGSIRRGDYAVLTVTAQGCVGQLKNLDA